MVSILELPESLRTASRVDIKICSSAYNGGNIGYVKHFDKTTGGMEHGNRRLKGHTYCTKMDVGQIAMHLPLHPSNVGVKVLLTGPFSPAQLHDALKDEVFNRDLVRGLLEFFRDHNIKYSSFDLSAAALDASPNLLAIPKIGVYPAHYKQESSSVENGFASQPTIVGQAISLKDKDTDADMPLATITVSGQDSQKACSAEEALKNPAGFHFVVKPSTDYLNRSEKEWLATAFPHLFPFGRGGLDEIRQSKVSAEAAFAHYLRLSSGKYQDFEFVLHGYSFIAQKQCLVKASLQARFKFGAQNQGESWAGLTDAQIYAAIQYSQACTTAMKKGRSNPPGDHLDPRAKLFCNSIRASSAAAQHTVDHAENSRVHLYSMHQTFGKPAFWCTITPDDLFSLKIWNISGSNIESLAGKSGPRDPPLASLRLRNISDNPGAAALTFDHCMRVFLEDVLKWDKTKRASLTPAGLFGTVSSD